MHKGESCIDHFSDGDLAPWLDTTHMCYDTEDDNCVPVIPSPTVKVLLRYRLCNDSDAHNLKLVSNAKFKYDGDEFDGSGCLPELDTNTVIEPGKCRKVSIRKTWNLCDTSDMVKWLSAQLMGFQNNQFCYCKFKVCFNLILCCQDNSSLPAGTNLSMCCCL